MTTFSFTRGTSPGYSSPTTTCYEVGKDGIFIGHVSNCPSQKEWPAWRADGALLPFKYATREIAAWALVYWNDNASRCSVHRDVFTSAPGSHVKHGVACGKCEAAYEARLSRAEDEKTRAEVRTRLGLDVGPGPVLEALTTELDRLDALTRAYVVTDDSVSARPFFSLLDARGGYRPSLHLRACDEEGGEDNARDLRALADAYDRFQATRGDDRRAYRGSPELMN